MKDSHLRQISIDQLAEGMHLSKLDISWLDSPFITNSKKIKKRSEIDALRKAGAKIVVIDTSKGIDVIDPKEPVQVNTGETEASQAESCQLSTFESKGSKTPLSKELQVATSIRNEVRKSLAKLSVAVEKGGKVEISDIQPVIESTLASLERNNQALLSLVHISRKAQKLADHCFGTFCLALNLGMARNLSDADKETLGLAALLHEAGWASIPLNLMSKRTRYSPSERLLVEKHCLLGPRMLRKSELPEEVVRIITEHHEKPDGSGYPNGLSGEEIHPLSQILIVVDAYEDLVHQLSDQPGLLPTNALSKLLKEAESGRFDQAVVAAFINILGIYPPASAVQLSTGEKALVVEVHSGTPLLPVLKICYDANGKRLTNPQIVDLSQAGADVERVIVKVIDPGDTDNDPYCLLNANELA